MKNIFIAQYLIEKLAVKIEELQDEVWMDHTRALWSFEESGEKKYIGREKIEPRENDPEFNTMLTRLEYLSDKLSDVRWEMITDIEVEIEKALEITKE